MQKVSPRKAGGQKGRRLLPPAVVTTQVLELIEWCNMHNGGQPVTSVYKENQGWSLDQHTEMWVTHRRVKRLVVGGHSLDYADSLILMDEAFGPAWRRGTGGMRYDVLNRETPLQTFPLMLAEIHCVVQRQGRERQELHHVTCDARGRRQR
jgi:hypothetical protein